MAYHCVQIRGQDSCKEREEKWFPFLDPLWDTLNFPYGKVYTLKTPSGWPPEGNANQARKKRRRAYSRVSNNRTNQKESFHSHVEHSN